MDAAASGSDIECPTCRQKITIPPASATNIHPMNPIAASAAAKVEHHFKVPIHDAPSEVLITKPLPTLDVSKDGDKRLRIRCIRYTDCVEVGKDRFEEIVSKFLESVGEENVKSINTVTYTYIDMGSRQILTSYGILIVYKG